MKLIPLILIGFAFNTFFASASFSKEPDVSFFSTPWSSKCQEASTSKEKICVLEKYLFEDKNQKNRVGGIGVRTTNQNKNTVITIISPLGISLSHGVNLGAGEEKLTTQPFIFCDSGGCVTQFIASEKVITALTNQKKLTLTYQLLNGRKVVITTDLEDFTSLYNAVKQ